MELKNKYGERLDWLVEGNLKSEVTVVFAHGNGVDKDEYKNLFVDVSKSLSADFRIFRFDFSGHGKSEGSSINRSMTRLASDLESVLEFVRSSYGPRIYIIAHSTGGSATSVLLPENIEKIILSGITNSDIEYVIGRTKERLIRKGGIVNEEGISLRKNASGKMEELGPNYWKDLHNFNPLESMTRLAKKTKLLLVHPLQDEIVGNEYMSEYKSIPNVKYLELSGDHVFSDPSDRDVFIKVIKDFLF